ncbi:MAG: MFS transporter [Noviherbaspirillum sp.]
MEKPLTGTGAAWRVFALFACGYFISYAFRGVNLGFAPYLTAELGVTAADLGLLTSLYFLGFAGAQIPAGMLLDRYDARRACAALMLVAAAGAVMYGAAQDLQGLMAGRLLIGIGLSVCLGGAYKALAQWFEMRRLPLVNGLTVAVGGMAGVAMGSPMLWLLELTDWRNVSFGLAGLTVAVALAIWLGVPRERETARPIDLRSQFAGLRQIWGSLAFWKTGVAASLNQGIFFAMQTLWVAPFVRDVNGVGIEEAGFLVSLLGIAMVAGSFVFGLFARRFERLGVSLATQCGAGIAVFILVQAAIMARLPLPLWLLWSAYGFFGSSGLLGYALVARGFAPHLLGRANTSFTLLIFLLVFVCQLGIGAVLDLWPARAGGYPPAAHLSAWGVLVALQVLSLAWYFLPARRGTARTE